MDMDAVDYFKEYGFAESGVNQIRYQPELDQLEIVLQWICPGACPPAG